MKGNTGRCGASQISGIIVPNTGCIKLPQTGDSTNEMEACGGSQHWARELTKQEHKVRLLQARFVKAFVMGNKNDVMDARAIWMAVQQPGKEIAVKTEEQQSVLVLHRSRRQLVK